MNRWTGFAWWLALLLASPAGAEEPPVAPVPETPPSQPAPAIEKTPLEEKVDWLPKVELRGRIEVDAVMASQSEASKAEIGDLQNGYGFRRARLDQGTIDESSRWVIEFDFARGTVGLRDVYVGLTALPGVDEVHVGYIREPFSLEGATSANCLTFMERSPLNELDPTRNWGFAGYWFAENERATFAIGCFRTDTDNGQSIGNGNNWAVTLRGTCLPVYEDGEGVFRLVHVGAAFSNRLPLNGIVVYDPGPQSSLLVVSDNPASPFLPRVDIPASSVQLYDLQAAVVLGSLSFQGEWIAATIQQTGGGVVFLHGFYVYASYFLTGEHRGYSTRNAAFSPVEVLRPLGRTAAGEERGCGAVELAARFSIANFASSNLPVPPSNPPDGTPGGTVLYQATWGVNWYLNNNTYMMFDYTLAVPQVTGSPALPVHVFGVRTAIFW